MSIDLQRHRQAKLDGQAGEVLAEASAADLLTAIEAFEGTGCAFGKVTTEYVRVAKTGRETFDVAGHTFITAEVPSATLILQQVVKTVDGTPTLRPFADLLVQHGITRVRYVALNFWEREIQYTRGQRWAKLKLHQDGVA